MGLLPEKMLQRSQLANNYGGSGVCGSELIFGNCTTSSVGRLLKPRIRKIWRAMEPTDVVQFIMVQVRNSQELDVLNEQ